MKDEATRCNKIDENVLRTTMKKIPATPAANASGERPYKTFSVAPNPNPQAAP